MPSGSKPGERRGGRKRGTPNKATAEVKDLAKQHGPAAIREAARLATGAESEAARVAAINLILDRAYGKPTQAMEHSGPDGAPIASKFIVETVYVDPKDTKKD